MIQRTHWSSSELLEDTSGFKKEDEREGNFPLLSYLFIHFRIQPTAYMWKAQKYL